MIPVASIMFRFALLDVLDSEFRLGMVIYSASRIGALFYAYSIPAGLQDSDEWCTH